MKFAIGDSPIFGDHLKSMNAKSIDFSDGTGQATGAKQMHQGMDTFWLVNMKVPELRQSDTILQIFLGDATYHGPIWPVCGWMPLVTSI